MKQNIATSCSFIALARLVFMLVLHADEVRLQLPPELGESETCQRARTIYIHIYIYIAIVLNSPKSLFLHTIEVGCEDLIRVPSAPIE